MDDDLSKTEVLTARGHENVSGEHASTFEVTSEDFLTPAGDCILGVEADRVPSMFEESFVAACQRRDATIVVTLEAGGDSERVEASGHPDLTFESDTSLVVRTSEYVDDRTVAIDAEKAAGDLDRQLVASLSAGARLTVTLTVTSSSA